MTNTESETRSLTRSTLILVVAAAALFFAATHGAGARRQDSRGIGVRQTRQGDTQGQAARRGVVRPELVLQTGHGGFGVTRCVFSPDGRLVATSVTGDDSVRLWETATGRELRAFSPGGPAVYGPPLAAFSQDNKLFAAGAGDDTVRLWDVATGRELRRLDAPAGERSQPNGLSFLAFGAGGRTLVAVGERVRTWDVESGVARGDVSHGAARPNAPGVNTGLALSPDGSRLAFVSYDGPKPRVVLLDTATGRVEQGAKLEGAGRAEGSRSMSLAFARDGRLVVAGVDGEKLKVWDADGEARTIANVPRGTTSVVLSPGGGAVAAAVGGSKLKAWDAATGRELATFDVPYRDPNGNEGAYGFAFSHDAKLLAAGGHGSPPALFDVASGKLARKLEAFGNGAHHVAFSADGTRLLSGARTLWDLRTGQGLRVAETETARTPRQPAPAAQVAQTVTSPDGKLVATVGDDNTIKLSDAASRRELRTLAGHATRVNSLAFSPDGRLLASAGGGSTQLWDAATGELLATLVSLFDGADWLVVTPDGLFDGSPRAWNQVLWRYDGDTFNVAPIEWFFNEFYTPGLLADLFDGKRPRAASDIARKDRRQPTVKLSLEGAQPAASSTPITTREVKVRVEVTDAKPDAENTQGSGARDLRLFRNGSLVKVWRGDVLGGKPSAVLEATVPIVAGENRFTAYAFNRDNVKSKDAPLALNGADSLKRAGTLYVLAVGVNEYANPQFNLKYAAADAREFAAEVARQQASVARFARTEIVTLLDRDATKANLLDALARLSGAPRPPTLKAAAAAPTLERLRPAQPEDAVLIFFAGHGVASGPRFYLVPHDLGYKGRRGALGDKGLRQLLASSVSDEELEAAVEGLDAGQTLLVIDACNSGQALEAAERRRGPMNSKGLAQLAYEKGMYILTAAQSFQAALEAAQLGHGYLTYALIEEGLKKGEADGAPGDGTLLAREWFDYAARRVPAMQEEKMKTARGLSLPIAFVEGEEKIADASRRNVQRPRVFYRRELETNPLIVRKR